MAVLRFDGSRLGKAQRLPGGGALVPAHLARTGVQRYLRDGKEYFEYRPPEEVFSAESLATFQAAPVTLGHPKEPVTPSNWKELSHGAIIGAPGKETQDGAEWVAASVSLQSDQALAAVERGDADEVSVGYFCDVIPREGTTPNGERYDHIQTNIRVNHVALLPEGRARAGRSARLTLDGNETLNEDSMKIRFDGQEYDTASEADMAVMQKRIDERDKLRQDQDEEISQLKTSNGELKGKLDAANQRADAADKALPGLVAAELKFREDMRPLLPEKYDFDGKSTLQVKIDAVKHRAPDASILKQDSIDEKEISGYVRSLKDRPVEVKKVETKDSKDDWRSDHNSILERQLQVTRGYDPKERN